MQRRLATAASALQRSDDADWKEVQSRLQPFASIADGPALPCVRRAVARIRSSFSCSNSTGWGSMLARGSSGSRVSGCGAWRSGCFSFKISRTVASPPPAFTSSGKTPQLSSKLERSRRAALIFPLKTNFVKARVSLSPVDVVLDGVGRCCCIVWPSWMRTSISPDFHASIRRCKQMRCSLAFELRCGFCNSSMGIVIAARMARGSSADFSA